MLLGTSGSGKSTLALTLNGLIPHALTVKMSGQVIVDDLDTQETTTATLSQQVGIVFQDPEAQFVTLKVEDEIVFGLENLRQPWESMSAKVDQALSEVDMGDYRSQRVDHLSGGQKQRIALACLLALSPSLLIFDEPTANLDPVGTAEVFDLLAKVKARGQHTLLLIEHKLDALIHLVDRVVVLGPGGHLLTDGSPQTVFYEQGELLKEHGIWMPQICLLGHDLLTKNLLGEHRPLTLETMMAVLDQITVSENQHQSGSRLAIPENDQAILTVEQLSFAYGDRSILDRIDLTIQAGEFLAIVGPNGAGKTTLAQQMMGILHPQQGCVLLEGENVSHISARDLTAKIGYVFQNPEHQFITNTVFEEVAYGLSVAGLSEEAVKEKTEMMLSQFGLAEYATTSPFTLSHGEKRRLSVATMLSMEQQILILDEPTFGQDQRNADEIMHLLVDLNQLGHTIIIITHDMQLVAEYVSRVVVMADGRLIFAGTPLSLFDRPDILRMAHLTPPPLIKLAQRLAPQYPPWAQVLTLAEAKQIISEAALS